MTNILSFADYRALADASAEASENHDRMLETIGRLSTVNLLNLSSHEQQKAIKAFYQAKLYAVATSKEFLAKVEKEVAKLGGRQLTSDETLALLMNHEPKAFRVGLQ